jgi:16S rRNA (guanine966-N2)-methyltransferase
MLESLDALAAAEVWDLFAGSGALGIEALSRGATRVSFVDTDAEARACIRANLVTTGFGPDRASVVGADVTRWVAAASTPADLVLADPPYSFAAWPALLGALGDRAGLVVAETGAPLELPAGWAAVRVKRYGSTVVTIGRPPGVCASSARPKGGT